MRAPKRPSTTGTPPHRSRSATSSTSGAATSGAAAPRKSGRRPRRVLASRVNWETSRQPPPVSSSECWNFPLLVVEDAEVEDLVGEVADVVGTVTGRDAEQGDEAPVDAADHLAIRLDRGSGHALQQGPHVVRSRASISTRLPAAQGTPPRTAA